MKMMTGFNYFSAGSSDGPNECGNEPSSFIKTGDILTSSVNISV